MNINRIGHNTTLASNISKPTKPEISFRDVLSRSIDEATKTDGIEILPVPQYKPINYGGRKLDYMELNNTLFKTFVKESIQFSTSDIKKQIDEICNDTTGESIDMDMLNECLDLYIEEKNKA